MKPLYGMLLLAAVGLSFENLALAQAAPTCNLSGCTISTSGSYIVSSGGVQGLTISANNVVLDLNGYGVAQLSNPGVVCTIVPGTRGNSCTSGISGNPAIKITGYNVTVKNGIVYSGFGTGINVTSPSNANSNVTLKDLTVSNFRGPGIDISTASVVSLINVQSNQNGSYGIIGQNEVTMQNVTANYNNNVGIQLNSGTLENVSADYNTGSGIISAGSITRARAGFNGFTGITGAAVIRDARANNNVSTGITAGNSGVVIDSIATQNGGDGFSLSTGVCYWGLSTQGNTGVAISGGTPLSGSTASCQ